MFTNYDYFCKEDTFNDICSPFVKNYFEKSGLAKTIKNQYFLGNKYYDYNGNNKAYDYLNYESLPPFYETGFDMFTLTDNKGKFYLIHPNELELKRNISGQIVGKSDMINKTNSATFIKEKKYSGYIKSKKIRSFLKGELIWYYGQRRGPFRNLLKKNR